MKTSQPNRRSLLASMAALSAGNLFAQLPVGPPAAPLPSGPYRPRHGYVLEPTMGEHLIHFRDGGNIFINISVRTGSGLFAVGSQQVMRGTGIPTHRHLYADEAFFILEGSGTCTLDDVPHSFQPGSTIFIPNNSWHSFSNPDHELLLLWLVCPGGLDAFFRETCSPPGAPPKGLSPQQIRQIAGKCGTEFR